jgi:hypothetical protein
MASTDFDPWQFLAEGRFIEAVAYFEKRQPFWLDKDWREPSTMATAYLCLHEFEKAAVMLSLANAMAARAEKRKEGPLLDHEGGALWLAGKKEEGAMLSQRSVRRIMDGTITHADFSGGIGNGLLLWYAGVTLKRKDLIADTERFLKKASKRAKAQSMPGPLAQLVLHGRPIAEILQQKYGEGDINVLENSALLDFLLLRELCQVLLCFATAKRLAGEENECRALMRRCSSLDNPLVQIEWFLARGEAEKH